MSKVALVTGATGFIGRVLVRCLESDGWRVQAGGRRPAVFDSTGAVVFDLCDTGPIELPPDIDTIFHLAGKAHALSEVAQDDREYARVNTDGTRRLLEAAAKAGSRCFVFFSSIKAAAAPPAGALRAVDEAWDGPPETAYGRSKREAERLVLDGGYVPHPVVLRPCLVYGREARGNLEKMIAAIRAHRFPPLPDFDNRRSMVHVEDVCRAALAVASHPGSAGRTYIVTDGVPVTTRQLFVWMCEAIGRPVPRWVVPRSVLRALGAVGDVIGRVRGRRFTFDSDALAKLGESAWYSSARLENETGWRAQRYLRESLPEIVSVGAVAPASDKVGQGASGRA